MSRHFAVLSVVETSTVLFIEVHDLESTAETSPSLGFKLQTVCVCSLSGTFAGLFCFSTEGSVDAFGQSTSTIVRSE